MDYIANYKKNLNNKSPEQLKALQKIFVKQSCTGSRQQVDLFPSIGSLFNQGRFNNNIMDQNMIKQLIGGAGNNSVNPLIIGDALLGEMKGRGRGRRGPMNMVTQNWLTN